MGRPVGLAQEQERTLDRLKSVPGLGQYYLAGGSAVAFHLGHRRSLDLDYAPLEPVMAGPVGFPTAGLRDLAAMKLVAIARRGIRRDFWDLRAIIESGLSLADAADAYVQRFQAAEPDLYHVLRSLTYFGDAERESAFPAGLTPEQWDQIKAFFLAEAPKLLTTS